MGATFPFWQRGQDGSWVSVAAGVPWAQSRALSPGCESAGQWLRGGVAGHPHPAPALTTQRCWASKPTGPYAWLVPRGGRRGVPFGPGCLDHPAGARKDGSASPSRSIPACPSSVPTFTAVPKLTPSLATPELAVTGVSNPGHGHPPPAPLPWDMEGTGMGTGMEAAFTWGCTRSPERVPILQQRGPGGDVTAQGILWTGEGL